MDDSIFQRNNTDDIDDMNKELHNDQYFLELTSRQNLLANLMKQALLIGAEKLLMARSSPPPLMNSEVTLPSIQENNVHYISKEVKNSDPLMNNIEFPQNILVFFAFLALKMAGLQINLILRLITFPIWFFNFWLMFLMFPFQTIARIKDRMKKRIMKLFHASYMSLISFILNRLKSPKSGLKLAIRIGRGLFSAFYVFFFLFGLFVSGFVISGVVMRNVVQEPIYISENLSFDYTKTSPVAVVPLVSNNLEISGDKLSDSGNLGSRFIPYNHKMKITVSLTLPESDYNRQLGIFQVRIESLSANGKVIVGSNHPTMLRFKSNPIRVIDTILRSVPLITGLQSEVQILKIETEEFTEGYEPTSFFKVILEQRAEFEAGSGAPEIYAASIGVSSELPRLRRVVWNWRRTIFVWISIASFVSEMMVVLIFVRPIILGGERSKDGATKKKSILNKVS